ncbi:SMEK domain-containing protein [Aquipseudomonas alcaligenes]|nr:SMEK domain-containing protein [Pseudomonas alcaligenes]
MRAHPAHLTSIVLPAKRSSLAEWGWQSTQNSCPFHGGTMPLPAASAPVSAPLSIRSIGKCLALRQLEIENELRDVVSRIINQVDLSTKQGRLDINLSLEDALIPILKAAYNLPNLINLNRRQKNFPGIDLGDDHDRVAFQVTATTSLEKVKKTLTHFVDKQFYNTFDELYVLMLTNKQASYSQSAIDAITNGAFEFSTKNHIIDLGDILAKVSGLRIPAQERVLNDFKIILGDIKAYLDFNAEGNLQSHTLTSNLITVTPPEKVYVAELLLNEASILEQAREHLNFRKNSCSRHSLVKMALLLNGSGTDDWVVFENRIFTFEDINNSSIRHIVDVGTIEALESRDLSESEIDDNINIFKLLLNNHVRETVKPHNIVYDRREKFFFFKPHNPDDEGRKEDWVGKKKSTRRVYEKVMSKREPTRLAHHVHLSFELSFTSIAQQWYALIVPSWLYTYDGNRKSRFHEDLLSKQKRLEFNQSVRNIVRFLAYYLRSINNPITKALPNNSASTPALDSPANEVEFFGELLEITCEEKLVEGEQIGAEPDEELALED